MGPGASGMLPSRAAHADQRRRAAAEHVHRAVPQRHRQASRTSFAATVSRAPAAARSTRPTPHRRRASARRSRRRSATTIRRRSTHGVRRGARAQGEPRLPRPRGQGRVGHPGAALRLPFGDNEKKMAADMADTAEEMLRAAGATDIACGATSSPKAGRSTRWARRAWANDPKTSVTNSFGQTHDVKNLFVVDGSIFVSACARIRPG